jgi:hypothetical protein
LRGGLKDLTPTSVGRNHHSWHLWSWRMSDEEEEKKSDAFEAKSSKSKKF